MSYARVSAVGVTLGVRMAAAEWVQDNLPQTLLSDFTADLAKVEAGRGVRWLHGDEALFLGAAVRDALAFTGGRWFRLFVGAASRDVEERAPPASADPGTTAT